jgi:sugar lactone lactonase YvrE
MKRRILSRLVILSALLIVIGALLIIIFFIPSPIDSVAWNPSQAPLWTGKLAPNNALVKTDLLGVDQLHHPEDITFDDKGRLYTGCEDGNIYRLTFNASRDVASVETFAKVGGFPLGLHFDAKGDLIVAVKGIGLLSLDPFGNSSMLTNKVNGTPITYANDLDIASNGTIYFSDSSTKFTRGWPYDILEAKPYGRILVYDPQTKETRILKDGLYFANGVALAPDESFLLVGETSRYRIARYWLKGPQAGTWDYFAENLPILVDNIEHDQNGNYFIAGNRRIAFLDNLQSNSFLKNQVAKIPYSVLVAFPGWKKNRYGVVLILSKNGNILESLQDPTGRVYSTSSAHPYKDYLYIGSLYGDGIARYPFK